MADKHRVLILGGGFGGLYAAQALKHAPVEITLVDRRNFHLFQPLLYQVATGSLSPGEIAAPLRGILSKQANTRVLLGEAADIDPAVKQVTLKDGGILFYDSLIVATGSQSTYFGHDQWQEWAPALKSIEQGTTIRHKILVAFEEAERTTSLEERQAWLTFVIVGAGATGVELAGALGEIARHTLKNDFRSIHPPDCANSCRGHRVTRIEHIPGRSLEKSGATASQTGRKSANGRESYLHRPERRDARNFNR